MTGDHYRSLALVRDINKIFKVMLEYEEAGVNPLPTAIAKQLKLPVKRVSSLMKLMEEI